MKKILGILLVLIIAAAILFFLYFKGYIGFGKGKGDEKKSDTSVSENVETTTDNKDVTVAEITVSGNDYLYNNEKTSLEALAAEIAKLDKDAEITITSDDTAAKNTVDELTDKLDELGYKNYKKIEK
ncbi:hypothetical protein [Ruminococcus flavefaciens]|uniref:hypothetical protein n=1 Tax=Ruminococcus flavefaciens TaxID=1265 RepID=UPI0026EAD62D|nr:hypothetical protein [Ruminococcus flavefaciens]MDD7516625.1 hypothetical protein [Ruminococcus flavefaciens]MDY5691108.1 hypothetical protein [Ruminococcus flavefaciens]